MGSKILRQIAKPIAKVINAIPGGNLIASAALAATGNPEFIPLLTAANTYGSGGSLGQAALSAGGSYLGGKFGSNIFGDMGTVGQGLSNTFGNSAGNAISSNIGELAGSSISGALGGYAGNALANEASGFNADQAALGAPKAKGPAAFKASRAGESELPASLSALGGLNQQQQSSNLATQGVYGGGLGPDEQSYFNNLINRRLVDDNGAVDSDMSKIQPIESSYLQQQGLGGYTNTNDLLEMLSKWKRA